MIYRLTVRARCLGLPPSAPPHPGAISQLRDPNRYILAAAPARRDLHPWRSDLTRSMTSLETDTMEVKINYRNLGNLFRGTPTCTRGVRVGVNQPIAIGTKSGDTLRAEPRCEPVSQRDGGIAGVAGQRGPTPRPRDRPCLAGRRNR